MSPSTSRRSRRPSRTSSIEARKNSHLRLCLEENVTPNRNEFDLWRLEHDALPGISFEEIDTGTAWLGRRLRLPVLIASMTGGAAMARTLNERLAAAAERHGVAFALGSCRIILENRDALSSFDVRRLAPNTVLLANLGAVQLNYGVSVDDCRRVCDLVQADGLVLHLNPMQEAIQPGGDRNFAGLLARIETLVKELGRPVIVKEVGCGISGRVARRLASAGVEHIDVSGRGGTSWPGIEAMRGGERGGALYSRWGIPTPEALLEVSGIPGLTVIAGGGIRHGLDVARSLAMGAHLAAMALPFVRAASESDAALDSLLVDLEAELRLAMFGTGSADLAALRRVRITRESMM